MRLWGREQSEWRQPVAALRAVDETGHQIAVFGRIGSRPFTLPEMQQLYLDAAGKPWTVTDDATAPSR